ncbi:hypothetical protein ACWEOE_18680 [Amycolatopsis sp. NPDC004368]
MSDQPAKQLSEILSGAPTNWGRWGAEDEIGALNLLGPRHRHHRQRGPAPLKVVGGTGSPVNPIVVK